MLPAREVILSLRSGVGCRRGAALVAICLALTAPRNLGSTPQEQSPASDGTATTGAPDGRITGRITVKQSGTLPEMIVFLKSLDPQRRFAVPSATATISQKGARFTPSLLIISVGRTVEFLNDEDRAVQHNVFSKSSTEPFDLGLYKPGVSKSVTFDKPGVVRLHCSIHHKMDGVIYVCPTPFFARVAADGRFVIEDVPAGTYELRTWQRRRRFREVSAPVEVKPKETVVLDLEVSRN